MNCSELHAGLAQNEVRSAAEREHLKGCGDCSALIAELDLIISTAPQLREANEPSPRVWNSIEIALRQEGLIRPQRPNRSLLPAISSRWAWTRWAVPAAAILLLTVGILLRPHSEPTQLVKLAPPPDMTAGLNDADLMQEVSQLSPDMQAQYSDNLRHVNAYIEDAKNEVAADPNDEEARRALMEAYQQKSMLFELAMDRSMQ